MIKNNEYEYIRNVGNEEKNDVIHNYRKVCMQLDNDIELSFEDFAEFNFSIMRLEGCINDLIKEMDKYKEEIEFSTHNKAEIITKLKIFNYKLNELKMILMASKGKSFSITKTNEAILEAKVKGGIYNGKE